MDKGLDAYVDTALQKLRQHGHLVQGVFGSPLGSQAGFWYYTVGLTALDHPELMMSGPTPEVATPILNDLAGRIRAGSRYHEADTIDDVVVGYPVTFVEVDRLELFPPSMVKVFFPDLPVRALQVVMPDSQGRFWYEDGYSMGAAQDLMFTDWGPRRIRGLEGG